MQNLLATFFRNPNASHYRAVRAAVIQDATFSSTSMACEIAEVMQQFSDHQFAAVRQRIADHMPGWSLCPRIHFLDGVAAEELGQFEDAELARFCFQSCLSALLETGSGTSADPYLVTYSSDEHDILQALGLQAKGQSLVERVGRRLDVVSCSNDQQLWFDVTDLLIGEPTQAVERLPIKTRRSRITPAPRRKVNRSKKSSRA